MKHRLPNGESAKELPCIAVIEDNPMVRSGMELVLNARGCEVVFHDRAEGALAFVRRHRPAVVIVDLHLEYRDAGLDIARHLRHEPDTAHVPVVVWSTDLEVGRKVAAAGLEGITVLSKFGHGSVLLAALETLTAQQATHNAVHADEPRAGPN